MDYAGLIFDDSRHYLDHLALLCALLQCPLIVCEEKIGELARKFYPDLEVVQKDLFDLKLPPWVLTCDNGPLLQAAFPNQTVKTIWLPHGNSDKGWDGPFFEGVGELALVYGQKMVDFMHRKGAFPKTLRVGNFRWHYFLKHQSFYERLSLWPAEGTLYAPTWDDSESNGTFWKAFPHLAETVQGNLLIKLHPNTVRKFEPELEILMGRYAKKENIHFLPDFPPIYPLLNRCKAYIGDMSSIGYDFLTFDRPMYFLNANPHFPLHRCGRPVHDSLEGQEDLSSIRKETYNYTFDRDPHWNQLKESLHALCRP